MLHESLTIEMVFAFYTRERASALLLLDHYKSSSPLRRKSVQVHIDNARNFRSDTSSAITKWPGSASWTLGEETVQMIERTFSPSLTFSDILDSNGYCSVCTERYLSQIHTS